MNSKLTHSNKKIKIVEVKITLFFKNNWDIILSFLTRCDVKTALYLVVSKKVIFMGGVSFIQKELTKSEG